MKKRTRSYFENSNKKNDPMTKEQVHNHPDNKIDQDFPGFPHGQSKENIINPKTTTEKKVSDINNTDGEKKPDPINEGASDASASAFDATEKVSD